MKCSVCLQEVAKYKCEECHEKYCGADCQKVDWMNGHMEECNNSIWMRFKRYGGNVVGFSLLWEFIKKSSVSLNRLLDDFFDFENEGLNEDEQLIMVNYFLNEYNVELQTYYNVSEKILRYKIAIAAIRGGNESAKVHFRAIETIEKYPFDLLIFFSGDNPKVFVSEYILNEFPPNAKYYANLYAILKSKSYWPQILLQCIRYNKNNFFQYQMNYVKENPNMRISLFAGSYLSIVDLLREQPSLCLFAAVVSDNEFIYDRCVKQVNSTEWTIFDNTMNSPLFRYDNIRYRKKISIRSCFFLHACLNGCVKLLPKLTLHDKADLKPCFRMGTPEVRKILITKFPIECKELYLMSKGSEAPSKKNKK